MMKQLRLDYPTSVLSRMLVVSASGYYAWVDRAPSKRAREEVRLELEIKAAHKRTRQTYGPERLQRDLAEHGVRVGIGRIKRIRKKLGIRCKQKRRFKATTQSRHRLSVAENVLGQQFKVYRPNAVWVTDITYVPTDEGWLYLAGHKDLFTGEIVGYAMGAVEQDLVEIPFEDFALPSQSVQVLHHSDQGQPVTAPRSGLWLWNGLHTANDFAMGRHDRGYEIEFMNDQFSRALQLPQ